MRKNYYSPEEAASVVERYHTTPTPEHGERVLEVFENLIVAYFNYLRRGKLSPSVRFLSTMLNNAWLPPSLASYSDDDLFQELRYCVLDVAKRKGHVVYTLPFAVRSMIRRLTEDPTTRTTDFGDIDERGQAGETPTTLIIRCNTLTEEEKWLLVRVLEGWSHREITEQHTEQYAEDHRSKGRPEGLSRRRISEKIGVAKRKLAQELLGWDGDLD
jgi:hypothetical protein